MRIAIPVYRASHEPTPAQLKSGRYRKRKWSWAGLTIAIENEAGSVRRGTNRAGEDWETRMLFAYGEIEESMGVDGDKVDVFVGPNPDAPNVYVVHQRRSGDWEKYDEDKSMICFDSEEDAKAAFLGCYSDPRFLGPITTMPVAVFVEKVLATKGKPAMIKAIPLLISRPRRAGRRDAMLLVS